MCTDRAYKAKSRATPSLRRTFTSARARIVWTTDCKSVAVLIWSLSCWTLVAMGFTALNARSVFDEAGDDVSAQVHEKFTLRLVQFLNLGYLFQHTGRPLGQL